MNKDLDNMLQLRAFDDVLFNKDDKLKLDLNEDEDGLENENKLFLKFLPIGSIFIMAVS